MPYHPIEHYGLKFPRLNHNAKYLATGPIHFLLGSHLGGQNQTKIIPSHVYIPENLSDSEREYFINNLRQSILNDGEGLNFDNLRVVKNLMIYGAWDVAMDLLKLAGEDLESYSQLFSYKFGSGDGGVSFNLFDYILHHGNVESLRASTKFLNWGGGI